MTDAADPTVSCRMNPILQTLAKAWVADIIRLLGGGTTRFGAFKRQLKGRISARVLSQRLKELESLGLVTRQVVGEAPLHVEYSLTPAGRRVDSTLKDNEASSIAFGVMALFENGNREDRD